MIGNKSSVANFKLNRAKSGRNEPSPSWAKVILS